MIDNEYSTNDLRKIDRYNTILKLCKKNTKISELKEHLPCTGQIIRLYCLHLTNNGFLNAELLKIGKFSQLTWHFKSLKNKYDESYFVSNRTKRNTPKEEIEENMEHVPLLPNARIIKERMVMSVRPKSSKNFISGASLSASTW